jgi:ATPase family protein associated with various cellular activities (AAA)
MNDEDVQRFAIEYMQFMRDVHEASQSGEERKSSLRKALDEFLGLDTAELPVISETYATYEHVNVQVALDAYLAREGVAHELIGIAGGYRHEGSMSDMLAVPIQHTGRSASVEYRTLPTGPRSSIPCIMFGLLFITDGDRRVAVLVRGPHPHGMRSGVLLEATSSDEAWARSLLEEIRALALELNVFRGQVVSFGRGDEFDHRSAGPIVFFERPDVGSDQLILPDSARDAIEAQVFGIERHKERLLASGQHLKRGLLLHGPPGTGKTLTVRHLTGRLTEHTVVLLAGGSLGMITAACGLARMLQPSVVVLEDVDLVAMERTYTGGPILFEVLNQMDGLEEDANVVFLLTTNRADLLEPALAARPGRVDLAIEIPLPDADARRRLIELYGRGVDLRLEDPGRVVERTAGVTASFVKELMRKASLLAALGGGEEAGTIVVTDAEVHSALDELMSEETSLTRRLLGGGGSGETPARPGAEWLSTFDPGANPSAAGWASYDDE